MIPRARIAPDLPQNDDQGLIGQYNVRKPHPEARNQGMLRGEGEGGVKLAQRNAIHYLIGDKRLASKNIGSRGKVQRPVHAFESSFGSACLRHAMAKFGKQVCVRTHGILVIGTSLNQQCQGVETSTKIP
jgi:hypothetical protein